MRHKLGILCVLLTFVLLVGAGAPGNAAPTLLPLTLSQLPPIMQVGDIFDLTIWNGTPFGDFYLYATVRGLGTSPAPQTGCSGLTLGIKKGKLILSGGMGPSGLNFTMQVPNRVRGRTVHLQAVDQASCTLSNIVWTQILQ